MKRYVAELIATYFMVFCGTGAIIIDQETGGTVTQVGIAISFGVIITVMIFAYGRISGAHMNPSVTLTLVLLHLHPKKDLAPYIVVQIIGGILASLTLLLLFPNNAFLGSTNPSGTWSQSFVLEFILTLLLMLVILFTSQGRRIEQYFAPFAIGLTVLLEAQFAGPICGASMNPARSIAPAIVSGSVENLWIYIVATTAGALIAGIYWKWQTKESRKQVKM